MSFDYSEMQRLENIRKQPAPSAGSGNEEARAWILERIRNGREFAINGATLPGILSAYAVHIRQQQREQDAKIAEQHEECERECGNTQAEMSAQRIAAAIRSGE